MEMSVLAARIVQRSRGITFSSSKRVIRHATVGQDLLARSFSSRSDDEEIRHDTPIKIHRARDQSSTLSNSSVRWPQSLSDEQRIAKSFLVPLDTPFLSKNARQVGYTASTPLFLNEGGPGQSILTSDAYNMSGVRLNDYLETPQAMKRLIYTSTVRAWGSQSTPFQQSMHRVVQRACFSTQQQEPQKEGTSSSGSGSGTSTSASSGNVSTSTKSASFSTSIMPTKEDIKSYAERAKEAIISASKSIVTFFLKLPGVIWFYLTHPKDLKARLQELKEAAQHEINHYYMGSKLLVADVKTAYSMLKRTLQGSALSRRERKQLLRTVSDLFRLVPFSMFVLIPFMEFALPFALRLFPNMLPSTFQDSLKAEESMKRELKSRIAMAAFFQETLQDLVKEQQKDAESRKKTNEEADNQDGKVIAAKQEESASAMLDFLEKARNGEMIPPEVIIQYANYFQDDLTLDNMPRMQLINMCKYMNIPPYGSDAFLRFQLRHKIRTLKEDDQRILWEGIDSLTKMELREACQERGMRSTGLSKDGYKRSLQQWLDLSVNKNVPISLLIMSRTFFLRDEMMIPSADDDGSKSMAGLADAISGLDKDVVNEVVLEVATREEKKSNPDVMKIKLEVLEQQNERIREEQEERKAAAKKKEQEKEKEKEKLEASREESAEKTAAESDSVPETEMEDSTKITTFEEEKAAASSDAKVSESETVVEESKPVEEEREEEEAELSPQEMDAISQLANPDPVNREREDLERIKAAMKVKEDESELVVEVPDGEKVFMDETVVEPITKHDKAGSPQEPQEAASTSTDVPPSDTDETEQEEKRALMSDAEIEAQTLGEAVVEVQERKLEEPIIDEGLDKAINRLKNKVESMVEKIETQLTDVEVKIGDKLHFLDKDMDGIVTREEMALCLQQVLKRELTFDEALSIAAEMDADNDGVLTVAEFISWIDTHKLVTLIEEGRDTDIDSILAKYHQKDEADTSKPEAKEAS